MTRVLIITDQQYLYGQISEIVKANHSQLPVDYRTTEGSFLPKIDVTGSLADTYSLIFSVHCRRIFPPALVKRVPCVNLHPGFNPYNRGWFPHVFSMINGLKTGATLHLMDEQIDHGPIIATEEVLVHSSDTSAEVYERILLAEVQLFKNHFASIVTGNFTTQAAEEGNYNSKRAYQDLCCLDLNQSCTGKEFIDRLRALSHNEHRNAYFIDEEGRKVFVRLVLESDQP